MPLPTAPSKRAALLSLQDFNVPARPKAKGSTPKPQTSKSARHRKRRCYSKSP